MGVLFSGGTLLGIIKLWLKRKEKKIASTEKKKKKLIVEASIRNIVIYTDDETLPPPTSIRFKLTNPKDYEVRIHTLKLLSQEYRELEVINCERPKTIFPGPENIETFTEEFPSLKSVQKNQFVFVRLIDHEDQYHDSSKIKIT